MFGFRVFLAIALIAFVAAEPPRRKTLPLRLPARQTLDEGFEGYSYNKPTETYGPPLDAGEAPRLFPDEPVDYPEEAGDSIDTVDEENDAPEEPLGENFVKFQPLQIRPLKRSEKLRRQPTQFRRF